MNNFRFTTNLTMNKDMNKKFRAFVMFCNDNKIVWKRNQKQSGARGVVFSTYYVKKDNDMNLLLTVFSDIIERV